MSENFEVKPLSSKPLFETKDPDQISRYMSNAFRPNRSQLRNHRSQADFCHRQVAFASTSINAVRYGREAFVDAPPTNDTFLGMFTVAGFADVDQGQQTFTTRPGTFCVLNPSQHLHIRLSRDFEQLTVKPGASTVRRALFEMTGVDASRPLEFAPRNFNLSGGAASFAHLVEYICQNMSRAGPALTQPCVSRNLESALVNLLLSEFANSHSELLQQQSYAPAPYYVKRAEEYIREQLCLPLTLAEIARAAGTSVRSLQYSFRQFRDTTPTAYLREQRLQRAREMLWRAVAEEITVTEVAMACGFRHLSKFAQHYRHRFGESPMQTKQRVYGSDRGLE